MLCVCVWLQKHGLGDRAIENVLEVNINIDTGMAQEGGCAAWLGKSVLSYALP